MENKQIRDIVYKHNLRYVRIAERAGIGHEWLSRLMAKPLSDANREKIMKAIHELIEEGEQA